MLKGVRLQSRERSGVVEPIVLSTTDDPLNARLPRALVPVTDMPLTFLCVDLVTYRGYLSCGTLLRLDIPNANITDGTCSLLLNKPWRSRSRDPLVWRGAGLKVLADPGTLPAVDPNGSNLIWTGKLRSCP